MSHAETLTVVRECDGLYRVFNQRRRCIGKGWLLLDAKERARGFCRAENKTIKSWKYVDCEAG